MELHQLRYFCAVVRAGNFTRAAENQHIAQPSLSQQIHKLENELGARLFDRFPRFARLTESGKAFLPRAETILWRVDEARTGRRRPGGRDELRERQPRGKNLLFERDNIPVIDQHMIHCRDGVLPEESAAALADARH